MKKLIISSLVVGLLSVGGFAVAADCPYHGGDKHPKKHMRMMKERLDLSDKQAEQIKAIMKESRAERKGQRGQFMQRMEALDPSSSDYSKQLNALADEQAAAVRAKVIKQGQTRAKIHAILTPEQREKMQQLHQERKEKMHKKMQKKWSEREDD